MVYSTEELKAKLPMLLNNTKQYFFFSSSRCYAKTDGRITEESPRLVDTCTDAEYLSTDEYGLAKGREENLLIQSGENNWTIIRPYITYNTYRIQLGVYEKENWLRFEVSGDKIEAVHMIPGWTHNIINLSETENLVTVMTCNEIFNPERPDTFFEPV